MNRISHLFPRDRFPKASTSKRLPGPRRTRAEVEAMLRDVAYVLRLTRSVKEEMVWREEEEAV